MIGIKEIASFVPLSGHDNFKLAQHFGKTEEFVKKRIGGHFLPVMDQELDTSDIGTKALLNLISKANLKREDIDCLVVCTQNPDGNGLPHTSAIIQKKAELPKTVAAFDISLGCSGFVYGLNIVKGFMHASDLKTGILITADPYSKIVNSKDPNTAMLFGDAATATLLTSNNSQLSLGPSIYGTDGTGGNALINKDGQLYMNGRAVFNFAVQKVCEHIPLLLRKAGLLMNAIDCYILHQGSRYLVETIAKRLGIKEKVICAMEKTGNTISSSIPLILEQEINNHRNKTILISGFGVGFSIGSMILFRNNH